MALALKPASLSRASERLGDSSRIPSRVKPPKWLKLRYVLTLGVLGWAGFYYWHTQYPELSRLQHQQQQLQSQVATMNQKHDELFRQVQEFQTNTYIARYASQHFNLVLPGQVPFNVQH